MKALIISITLMSLSIFIYGQEFQSSFELSGSQELIIWEMQADENGNVTVIGDFYDSLDIDPGVNKHMVYTDKMFDPGVFIASYTSSGQLRWGLSSDSLILMKEYTKPQAMHVFKNGVTYFACQINGTVDVDPGVAEVNVKDTGQVYVVKITADGVYADHYQLTEDPVESFSFAMDNSMNMYLTGSFAYDADGFDVNGGAGTKTLTSNGLSDNFVAKYNSVGQLDMAFEAFNFGTTQNEYGSYIWVNNMGQLVISGGYNSTNQRTMDLDPSSGNTSVSAYQAKFIAMYNTDDGSFEWGKSLGDGAAVYIRDLAFDSDSNIYLSGEFNKDAIFDFGSSKIVSPNYNKKTIFFAKYSNNAELDYVKKVGYGASVNSSAKGIIIDSDDNIMIMGDLVGTLSLNTDDYDYTDSYSPKAAGDIFISKYNKDDGSFLYADFIESTSVVTFNDAFVLDSSFYIAGNFMEDADLDVDTLGINNVTSTKTDVRDVFVAEYKTFLNTNRVISAPDILASNTISVLPNPVYGNPVLTVNSISGDIYIRILDMTGQIVREQKGNKTNTVLNMEGLDGVYLIEVLESGKSLGVRKVLKY